MLLLVKKLFLFILSSCKITIDFTGLFMKFLLNILPAICFFATYKFSGGDLVYATIAIVISSLLSFIATYALFKEISRFQIIILVVLLIFSVPTIIIKDPVFIKAKVSVVNVFLALAILVCQFGFKKNIVKALSGFDTPIPEILYKKATIYTAIFLCICAVLNYILAFRLPELCMSTQFCSYDEKSAEDLWVNYKTYGNGVLNTVFIFGLSYWIMSKLTDEQRQALEDLMKNIKDSKQKKLKDSSKE